jgi:uncharacterized protein
VIRAIFSMFAGAIFSVGLVIGGMTTPAKVIGFLDFFGAWDPSLALVIIGALAVHVVTYRLIVKRPSPIFGDRFRVPRERPIDRRLVIGSAIFGLGWGLGGFCPGPAVTALPAGGLSVALLGAGMVLGIFSYERFVSQRLAAEAETSPQ